eukprot:5222692-Amphidinium_carterae.1
MLDGVDPKTVPLVRQSYNSAKDQYQVVVPYIFIFLGLSDKSASSDMRRWLMAEYQTLFTGPDSGGDDFEAFCAGFRALKAECFDDGAHVLLKDLHAGAAMEPSDLHAIAVVNRHLVVHQSKGWYSTKVSEFGRTIEYDTIPAPGAQTKSKAKAKAAVQKVQVTKAASAKLNDGTPILHCDLDR